MIIQEDLMKYRFFKYLLAFLIILAVATPANGQKASSYVNLGVSYYQLKKYEEAIQQFKLEPISTRNIQTSTGCWDLRTCKTVSTRWLQKLIKIRLNTRRTVRISILTLG